MSLLANIKSAEKRIDVIKKKNEINRKRKSEIRTYIRKFDAALESGNIDEAKELLKLIEKKLYRASTKSTMHKNVASRKVSRLTKRLNQAI